jgi:hypothetical protein
MFGHLDHSAALPPLYHWSPATRRASINRRGLLTGRHLSRFDPVPDAELDPDLSPVEVLEQQRWRATYICLGFTADAAASVSWRVFGEPGQEWDLWQVYLGAGDEVHVRPEYGPQLWEVRVHNPIPKRRVHFLASRVLRAASSRSDRPR